MPLKRNYTMSEVQDLLYQSEGRRPLVKEDGGHTVNPHGDGRSGTVADGRRQTAIILAETIDKSRAMDPSEGFAVISTDEKDIDARFTTRLDLIKAVNSAAGQTALVVSKPVSLERHTWQLCRQRSKTSNAILGAPGRFSAV